MGNCLGVNNVSDTSIIVPAVKTKKDYELTDAFNKRISSHPDFLAFVASHKLDSYHQHQWKCKMQMMMTGQSKSIVECVHFARSELDSMPPIRLIDFEVFLSLKESPRCGFGIKVSGKMTRKSVIRTGCRYASLSFGSTDARLYCAHL
jgi:hypothetical protein